MTSIRNLYVCRGCNCSWQLHVNLVTKALFMRCILFHSSWNLWWGLYTSAFSTKLTMWEVKDDKQVVGEPHLPRAHQWKPVFRVHCTPWNPLHNPSQHKTPGSHSAWAECRLPSSQCLEICCDKKLFRKLSWTILTQLR